VLAARLLGRPSERVGRKAAVAVHLLLSVGVLFVLGVLYLAGSIVVAVFAPPQVSMVGGGLLVISGLLLGTVAVGWWVLATRWIPAVTRETGDPVGTVRRQATLVVATYVVVAVFTYPVGLFVMLMLVFFR
jgi:MFS family permease